MPNKHIDLWDKFRFYHRRFFSEQGLSDPTQIFPIPRYLCRSQWRAHLLIYTTSVENQIAKHIYVFLISLQIKNTVIYVSQLNLFCCWNFPNILNTYILSQQVRDFYLEKLITTKFYVFKFLSIKVWGLYFAWHNYMPYFVKIYFLKSIFLLPT